MAFLRSGKEVMVFGQKSTPIFVSSMYALMTLTCGPDYPYLSAALSPLPFLFNAFPGFSLYHTSYRIEREKFSPEPGLEPRSPALCTGPLTIELF